MVPVGILNSRPGHHGGGDRWGAEKAPKIIGQWPKETDMNQRTIETLRNEIKKKRLTAKRLNQEADFLEAEIARAENETQAKIDQYLDGVFPLGTEKGD